MAFDGTLKFDTSIDKSGFESGLAKLGSIAKAGMAAVTGAITAASGAMAALGTQALVAYADYEQLTGGVATLFGAQDMSLEEYAQSVGKTVDAVKGEYDNLIAAQDSVMQNAAEAFRTAGLSQNEYMETVTSFSAALIASLDGDTAKAAQVADRAIVDMADNANKMGSSMESIQNAYQGFAKQNYTMLDNLKLGYGGTKSEMERLLADAEKLSGIHYNLESYADIVEAIHVIQTEMHISGISAEEAAELVASGALTEEEAFARMGTTAKEAATTIQGSVGATKAAFANLLVGIADDEQDFEKLVDDLVRSAATAAGNILPRVETIIGGIGKMISSLSGIAADMLVDLTAYVPDLIEAGVSLIGAVADGLTQNAPAISQAALDAGLMLVNGIMSVTPDLIALTGELISTLIDGLTEHLPALADAAMKTGLSILSGITAHLPDIIETAKDIIKQIAEIRVQNIPLLADAAVQIIGALVEALTDPALLTALLDAALQIILTLAQALLDNIPQVIEILSTLITNVIDFIIEAVPMLLDAAVQLFMAIVDALPEIIEALTKELPKILEAVVGIIPQLAQAITKALPQIINAVTQALPIVIQALIKALPGIIRTLIDAILLFDTQMLDAAIQLFDALLEALPVVVEMLIPMIPEIITELANILTEAAPQLLDAAITLFMAIVDAIPGVIDSLVTYFGEMLSIVTEWLGNIFASALETVKTGFTNMVTNAKQLASDLVDGAMQFLDELPGKLGHMIGDALGHIVQFAIDAPQKAKELAEQFIENVVEFFSELPGKVKEWLDSTIEKVKQFAADLAKKGEEGAADLVKKVTDGVSELPGKMLDVGRNIVSGLWNGITSMGSWLRDQISGFAGGILDGFKESFGIASPSKVMRDSVGKYLAQGLGIGFMDEIPQIGQEALKAFGDIRIPAVAFEAEWDIPDPPNPEPVQIEAPEIDLPELTVDMPEIELPELHVDVPEFEIPELPELTIHAAEIEAPEIQLRTDKLPQIDSDAVRMLQTVRDYTASDFVQPSPTSEITNNYYSSTTNNRTDGSQPIINVHVHLDAEMDGEKIAEKVAEKVDILQGEAITMDERGTAH